MDLLLLISVGVFLFVKTRVTPKKEDERERGFFFRGFWKVSSFSFLFFSFFSFTVAAAATAEEKEEEEP